MGKLDVVLGAQWGDEGKGKVIDHLAADHPVAVRFNGGANAGHTIEVAGEKTIVHLLPSNCTRGGMGTHNLETAEGTLYYVPTKAHPGGAWAMVGPGVVVDPVVLEKELALAISVGTNVSLDRGAPVVLPIHKHIDALRETAAGASAIGTTKRGIGPCYEDLVSRRGPKLGDLVSEARFRKALTERGWYDERAALVSYLGGTTQSLKEVIEWAKPFGAKFAPHLDDVRALIAYMRSNAGYADVLLEGAQGVMLDVMHGSWPDCTSSHCTAGGAAASLGVYGLDRVIGVAKAYLTRVGNGPFPTELWDEKGELLRQKGAEYGATTGRPRRCGWLDLAALRYAVRVGGIRELCVTKLDVLSNTGLIMVCTGYTFEDRILSDDETLTSRVLREAQPHYACFDGWTEDISGIRRITDLPDAARAYLAAIKRFTGVPVTMVGVGPERDQIAV